MDSYVRAFFATDTPHEVRQRMRVELILNRDWLTELADRHRVRGNPMPLARVADIAIWMVSRSA
jgi:hypothetical protein